MLERYRYYQRLLGLTGRPERRRTTSRLERRELTEENFDEAYAALVEQYDKPVTLAKAADAEDGRRELAVAAVGRHRAAASST